MKMNLSLQTLVVCLFVSATSGCMRAKSKDDAREHKWMDNHPNSVLDDEWQQQRRPERIYRSRSVLLEDGDLHDAAIAVDRRGKISAIMSGEEAQRYAAGNRAELLDFGTYTIVPGVVDSHVHVNEPGRTDWEGYSSATRAAAWGGITTIVDMPLNSVPPTTTVQDLHTKLRAAEGKAHVDVAFWGGVVPGNEDDLIPLVEAGVRGFKCFTSPSGVDEFPYVERSDIEKALAKLQGSRAVLLYHAEMDAKKNDSSGVQNPQHPERYQTYLDSRPQSTEVAAIDMIIELTDKYMVRSHIVHLSAADALPALRKARSAGLPLSVETCHHYLTLSAEQVPDNHTEYKCAPPIRSKHNQDLLWSALERGDIDMVVSDHSPSTPDMKGICKGCTPDFLKAWGGIASVQFGLSLLWTGASARGLSLRQVSHLLSSRPAKLAGLEGRKGSFRVGLDADLVVWDPEEEWIVTKDIIQHKNKETPYLGMKLKGKVHVTVVRGNIVYRDGHDFGYPQGKLLL